jgi:hypothetical protein
VPDGSASLLSGWKPRASARNPVPEALFGRPVRTLPRWPRMDWVGDENGGMPMDERCAIGHAAEQRDELAPFHCPKG